MATVQSLTKARMEAIEDASVVSGEIDGSGHLILTTFGGTDIDAGSVLGSVPDASETVKGKVELATTAEATAGVDTTRAITAAGLAAAVGNLVPDATDTVKGKVELATNAETTTGSDTTRAVTPAGVAAAIAAFPAASTTVQGKVELATTGEATTGTDTDRAVTPAGLKAAIDAVLQVIYPVGALYMSHSVSTNPNTLLGFGTWTAVTGKVLIGVDGTFTQGSTGGAQTHTISTGNLPPHTHDQGSLDTATGGTHSHQVYRDFDGASGSARWTFHTSAGTGGGANTTGGTGDHDHSISGSTGNGPGSSTAINHMPPWHSVYIWRRTA